MENIVKRPVLIHKMPLHDTMVGVWHAVSVTGIIGPIFF
jgi:hypothetical protein